MITYLTKLENTYFEEGLIGFLIASLLILIIALIVSKLLKKLLEHHNKHNTAFYLRIKNMIVYGFAIYAILMQIKPLQRIGTTLLASGGIFAVVIGLAAQEALGNFVNGLMITIFKPFRLGDLIKMNDGQYTGTVVDISLRHTIIETFEKTKVIIPNSEMNKAVLENVSRTGVKGNFLDISISYESDVRKAMNIINEEVIKHPKFIDNRSAQEIKEGVPKAITRVVALADSSINLRTTVYSDDNATGFAMLCDLRLSIKERFDAEGISIPYPHMVIISKETNTD